METRETVTLLLGQAVDAVARGDGAPPADAAALYTLVYDELRGIARQRLRHERAGHTLATTDLVHEAYLKLADAPRVTAQGRAYFFAAAARAMRSTTPRTRRASSLLSGRARPRISSMTSA